MDIRTFGFINPMPGISLYKSLKINSLQNMIETVTSIFVKI